MTTGKELRDQLRVLADSVRPEVARLAKEKRWGEWWALNGYLGILDDGIRRMDKHGRRSLRAYRNAPRVVAIVGIGDAE
jgi:hypothetical protein